LDLHGNQIEVLDHRYQDQTPRGRYRERWHPRSVPAHCPRHVEYRSVLSKRDPKRSADDVRLRPRELCKLVRKCRSNSSGSISGKVASEICSSSLSAALNLTRSTFSNQCDAQARTDSTRDRPVEYRSVLSKRDPKRSADDVRGKVASEICSSSLSAALNLTRSTFSNQFAEFSGSLVMRKRVQTARATGQLNIAAFCLKEIPKEVLTRQHFFWDLF
jgi:hypothetical protein